MLRDSVEIAAYGFAALVAVPCVLCLLARLFRCVGRSPLWRQCRAVILALLAAATIATIKAQKRTGTTGVPPVAGGTTGTTGVSPVANPITNTLYISAIAVSSNDMVTLTAAWPENFLTAGLTLDVLGKGNLHEVWTWLTNGVITTGATNISWALENQPPSNYFYKVVLRDSLTDMDDPDYDGIPNVYELHHGTNPWMPDSSLVPKLTVGTNETYTSISTALAASAPYSVVEIVPGMYSGVGWSGVTLPEHPVLITGSGKRPVIRGDSFATFLLPSNSTEQTLLRNFSIDLGGRGGLRAGFWCGGNLPWSGQTASATFENIYVRMPDADAQYYGWIFYRSSTNRAVLSRCAVNAAGARDAVGVFAIDPSPVSVENCTFANFPSNAPGYRGAALLLKTTVQNFGCVSNEIEVTVTGSVFDDSFTDALPLARFEEGTNFLVRMQDCVLPHALESPCLPDYSSSLWVTNGQTAWSGHALVDSLVADLGLGALPILENDPSTDTDDDGLSDYEEVYERGTDPYLSDSDNDGVPDGVEVLVDGTDPTDPHSFTQTLTVLVTNTISFAYPVYTAWGYSASGWETNGREVFPRGFGTTNYVNASSHGATHVKAFCDLNGNGEYDANADILLMRAIPYGSTAQINFTFGDVDGDGVTDMQEREEQTDPYDPRNFRLISTVVFTNTDEVGMGTNFVAFSRMTGVWSNACLVASFTNGLYTLGIDTNLIEGTLRVMCLRDFDGDCEYSLVHDVLYEKTLGWSDNRNTVVYSLGDFDHDNLPDSKEMTEGTDPLNRADYCFTFSVTYTDIFSTTNQLSTEVFFGTNRIEGPITMTGRTWHCETGHLVSSNNETVTVYFWDDVNFNGVRDASETAVTNRFPITGHEMVVTNRLVYGAFDADNDEMLDSWELIHGLSPTNVADAVLDADRDGFVNLHEFWAGTDPNDPLDDGYGTALYAITHGIDDRIAISSLAAIAKSNYLNYSRLQLPEILSANPDSWALGIDFSCTSVWNDSTNYQYGDPATLLSPQHVLLAKHACSPIGRNYTFQDVNGFRCVRTLVATRGIDRTDITIGLLDSELPSTFSPVKLLPVGYERYIGSGTFLPVLHMDQERKSLVQELPKMPSFPRRYYEIFCNRGHTPRRLDFYEGLVGGDSGNPCFLLLGNERILLYAVQGHQPGNYYASAGYHTMLFGSEIQEVMNILSSARGCPLFVLQSVDLSSYVSLEN